MKRLVLVVLLSMVTAPVMADFPLPQKKLTVVEDQGGTSTESYFRGLGLLGEMENATPLTTTKPIRPVKDTDMLPVRSEYLTPGKVARKEIKAFGLTPMFLVGDDPLSKRWLAANRQKLIKLRASGMVVNVATPEALNELKRIVPELLLLPISGDDVGQRLGLTNYPVLITSTTIEQ